MSYRMNSMEYQITEPERTATEMQRLRAENDRLRTENEAMRKRLDAITAIVDEQAEDEGLWFLAQRDSEAYLQQELRRLHAAVEGER